MKEKLLSRKVQKTPMAKNPLGRVFFSRYTTPTIFFSAAVHGDQQLWLCEQWQPQCQQAQLGMMEGIREQAAV
jgi:hypothetical protein